MGPNSKLFLDTYERAFASHARVENARDEFGDYDTAREIVMSLDSRWHKRKERKSHGQ